MQIQFAEHASTAVFWFGSPAAGGQQWPSSMYWTLLWQRFGHRLRSHAQNGWGGRELKIWDADDVGCFFCFYVSWRATLKDVGARECFEKKAPVWLESLKVFWIKKSGWGFKTSQGVFSSLYCVWKSKRSDLSFHRCSSVCACVMLFGMPFELPVVNPAWNSWVDKHSFGWRTSFSSPSSLVGFGNLLLYSEVGW